MERTISVFIPSLAGGGAERVMVNLCNGFIQRGYEVDMVLLERSGPYLADMSPEVRVVDLKKSSVRAGVLPLAHYLRSASPDVMFSALDHANLGALIARLVARGSTRVIPTVHTSHMVPGRKSSFHETALVPLLRWLYPSADAIVGVSQGVAEDVAVRFRVPRPKVRLIYNPVITPRMHLLAVEPVDHPWLENQEVPVVVAVGRLTAAKDYPTLLAAARLLRQRRAVRLLILGEGEERPNLERLVESLGLGEDVSLPGFVDNPFRYVARASAFVLSSAWEALPTALIEALALGIPIVSTACQNGPAEILQGGRFGRLVPVGDADALADAIDQAIGSPPVEIPTEVLEPFTVDGALDRYESLLAELIP
ncbi:MAG: glycosyltransferase [Actinomycetia bacterium]|nr:glycosyltransferase [Actinomycetes bacterium]